MGDRAVRATPDDGDVVVRRYVRDGRRVFVLHTVPGPEQWVAGSREDAVGLAAAFAERQHVRVWSTDDGAGFVLLKDFRVMRAV